MDTGLFDIWTFLAGLGIFLMGLFFLEESLKNLAGRSFKKFLKKNTNNPLKAILSGTAITALLQSSSVVTLIVLAFVGAGVMTLRNALGVIIGSNLGTTFTGWIVATFGFKLDIEGFAMPFIAIGGLSLLFLKGNKKLIEFGRFVMGFGLLFLGLNFMKDSIETVATSFDITPFIQYGPYALFFVGLVLTAIIQSSSAAMVISLSAVHAGVLPLESAAGMVIGSDLGTTVTVLLGGLKGTASKKRVALSHFLFNVITDVVALIILYPLLFLITDKMGLEDPLIALVLFHSFFNLIGIFMIFPFLGAFANFLERRFTGSTDPHSSHIHKVTTEIPEAAITALKNEINRLIELVFLLNLKVLKIKRELFDLRNYLESDADRQMLIEAEHKRIYERIKQLEGEMIPFYLGIQNEKLEDDESNDLNQLIHSIQHCIMSAKGVKDIAHNVDEFERSANDHKIALFEFLRGHLLEFYLELHETFHSENPSVLFESLLNSVKRNQDIYEEFIKRTYHLVNKRKFSELDISTLLNVNREMYNADHALIMAIKDTLLSPEKCESFDQISLPALRF